MRAEIKERIEQIKQGIVPEGYKETKVGIIPEDWEVKRLGEVTFSVSIKNKENINYPVYSISNKAGLIPQNEQFEGVDSNDRGYDISLYKIIGEKTFVYNPARINVGSIGYSSNLKNIIVSSLYTCFKTTDQIFDNFLFGFIKSFKFNKQVLRNVEGGVRDYLFYENFSKIILPLPPLQEQEKIASILTQWDSLIEEQEKLIEEKRESFKVTQTNLLYGRKRFKCFSETNETFKSKVGTVTKDKSWKIVKIKSFFKTTSIRNCGSEELLSVTQDRGVIPRTMLDGNVTMPEGTEDNYKFVEKGNFIISLRSFQGGVEYSEYRGLVSPAYTVIEPTIHIDDSYYKYLFKNTDFINRMSSAVVGIRDGKQINFRDFGELYIQLPPVEEQQKISQFLSKLNEEILLQEEKLTLLREEKKILMQLLLTGIIRV